MEGLLLAVLLPLIPQAKASWRPQTQEFTEHKDIKKYNFAKGSSFAQLHLDPELANNDRWLGEQSEILYSHPRDESLVKSSLKSCNESCKKWWIGDGTCDKNCLNEECAFDNGDCDLSKIPKIAYLHIRKYASYGAQTCRIFSFECSPCSCGYWDPNAKRNGYGNGMHSCTIFTRPQRDSEARCENCVDDVIKTGCHYVELHHYDMSVARALREKGYKVITMLRHPVKLLESSYNYEAFARHGHTGQIPGYDPDDKGFEEWANDRTKVEGFDALRMLAGCWYEHEGEYSVPVSCRVNPTYNRGEDLDHANADQEKLSRDKIFLRAKAALASMDYVGITENFRESIELLHRIFFSARGECKVCQQIREGTKKENVQAQGHKYTFEDNEQLLAAINRTMNDDIIIYELARSRFNFDLQRFQIEPPATLNDLKNITEILEARIMNNSLVAEEEQKAAYEVIKSVAAQSVWESPEEELGLDEADMMIDESEPASLLSTDELGTVTAKTVEKDNNETLVNLVSDAASKLRDDVLTPIEEISARALGSASDVLSLSKPSEGNDQTGGDEEKETFLQNKDEAETSNGEKSSVTANENNNQNPLLTSESLQRPRGWAWN